MNRWQRQGRLKDAHETLERLLAQVPQLVGTLEAMTAGYAPAQRYDRDQVTASGISDPTGEALVADPAGARTELELLDTLIEELHGKVIEVDLMRHRWMVRPKGGESKDDPGCEIVARVKNPQTKQPFWEPVHVFSDAKGNLDRPHRLGSWAYRFILDTGRKPSLRETKDHIEGRKIKRKAS